MTPAAQIQPTQAQNFAPIEPLIRLRDGSKLPNKKISDALKDKFRHFQHKDSGAWREIINVGTQIELFLSGKQFPFRNPLDGSWSILPVSGFSNTNSQKAALNIMANYYANLESKWLGSNPDILVRPGRNIDQCAIAAKAGQVVWDYYNRRYYDVWYSRQECRAGVTFGTYLNRIRYDESVKSLSVVQDIFGTKNVSMGEGFGSCPSCGFSGPASLFPQNPEGVQNFGANVGTCPECQQMAFVEPPAQGEFPSMTGQEEQDRGELVCEQLPLPACRWDLMKRAEDSSWFIYRQEITRGAVERVLGNVKIPGEPGDNSQTLDGLRIIRSLAAGGQAIGGFSGYGNWGDYSKYIKDRVSFDEMWLGPDDYADITLSGDEKTISGETLPSGKLTDVFPDGLCCVGLNGMSVILGLYSEKHSAHISSGVWFVKGLSGVGRGLADTVEVQKQVNQFANQSAEYFDSIGTPAIGVDSQILPPGKAKYLGSPRTNIPFDLTKLPDGRTLQQSVWQFQAAPLPNALIQYYQQFLNVVGQKTSGVSDFNQGEPGITAKNTTATAAEIDQSNADQINQPIFQGKAQLRKQNAEITLKLYPQFFPMQRFLNISGKFGQQEGIELFGGDLEADLICEVITNSEMPKGPFTQRKNLMALFQITQGGQGYSMLKQADPKLAANLVQTFDVDIDSDDYEDVADLCRKRLDQMKKQVEVGITDPAVLVMSIEPPVSSVEPNLAQKGKWFSEILDSDELQTAPMPLRLACELLAQGQITGEIMQQAQLATAQGMVQTAGQAPQAVAQSQMEQANQQPNEPSADTMVGAEQQSAQNVHESEESDKQREHELKMKKMDVSMKKDEHKNKIAIAKSKPKPKTK